MEYSDHVLWIKVIDMDQHQYLCLRPLEKQWLGLPPILFTYFGPQSNHMDSIGLWPGANKNHLYGVIPLLLQLLRGLKLFPFVH